MTIFCSKNEAGIPAWQLVLEGKKKVTRRLKPMKVGKEFAVQPNRGKKAVCRARVSMDCISHSDWYEFWEAHLDSPAFKQKLEEEAHLEGFESWDGLLAWFEKKGIDINQTYRIEFELNKASRFNERART